MRELVEKVARAICAGRVKYNGPMDDRHLADRVEEEWRDWQDEAIAAIAVVLEALQEPSEGMDEGGEGEITYAVLDEEYPSAERIWKAMLAKFREEQGL